MNVNIAASAGLAIFDFSVGFCEQGIVFTTTDVSAGVEFGAALAHENASAGDDLAAVGFCAEALRVTVAAVS